MRVCTHSGCSPHGTYIRAFKSVVILYTHNDGKNRNSYIKVQHNILRHIMHVYIMYMCVCMYYSADTPLSVALSLVKVPPAHDTCVLQTLAPSVVANKLAFTELL